jgi:exopolyphosphatase/guanosine-5'-triphosphate,3'-diphosphate pyrophosphatase
VKFAAIDIGSNAVRLQIARSNDGSSDEPFKKIEFVRIPLRLGDDAFREGKIRKDKRKTFYKAMAAFRLLMDAFEVDHYMACATSAMREASNGEKIAQRVEEDTGIRIDIIDGGRESEIILRSITHLFERDKTYLAIDVGGGSTEMTVIRNGEPHDSVSFNIGTIRLLKGAVKEDRWKEMEDYVRSHIAELDNTVAIATSGTINKIAMMVSPTGGQQISRQELELFYNDVKRLSLEERIDKYRLNPERADVIEPSAEIYLRILEWANIPQLFAPSAGLKDGMIFELMDKYLGEEF